MHSRRRFGGVLVFAAATAFVVSTAGAPAGAQDTTTSSTPASTTTLAPTTSTSPPTTAPTTTSTTAPATTTTRGRPTTTTSHPATTTTTAAKSSPSSKTWGWILLAVVVLLALLLIVLLIARTRRQGTLASWRRSVLPAISAAELARQLVLSQTEADDPRRRADVAVQVDEAVQGLERAAATSPDETGRDLCSRCADSLRGLAFAVEADHLMRSGGQHPTGEQLASADAARRHRSAELDAALRNLKGAVPSER